MWKNVFLHLMTYDPYFDPLNGNISLGNTPSRIQHIEMIQNSMLTAFPQKCLIHSLFLKSVLDYNATKVKKRTEGQPNTAVSENPAVYEKTGIL